MIKLVMLAVVLFSQAKASTVECANESGDHAVRVKYVTDNTGKVWQKNVSVLLKDLNYEATFIELSGRRNIDRLKGDSLYNPDFFSKAPARTIVGGVYRVNLNFVKNSAEVIFRADQLSEWKSFTDLACISTLD